MMYHTTHAPTPASVPRPLPSQVVLHTLGQASAALLLDALAALPFPALPLDNELLVVLTDDYLQPDLAEINSDQLDQGRPWLLAKLSGATIWLGPLFVPGQTGCWGCLAQRLRGNRAVASYLHQVGAAPHQLPIAELPTVPRLAAELAAGAIYRMVRNPHDQQLAGRIATFNTLTSQIEWHQLVRRPQCQHCGDPLAVRAQPKQCRLSLCLECAVPSHASQPPQSSARRALARYQHHVSPITGVISQLKPTTTQPNTLLQSITAIHHFPAACNDVESLKQNKAGRSCGKGASDLQAYMGALGESLERYSVVWQGEEEQTVRASANDMAGQALDLERCLGFSATQYANRLDWNHNHTSRFFSVPKPFDHSLPIEWSALEPLGGGAPRYLPAAYCYFGHPDQQHGFCIADSNGCAAGNTLEEAIMRGFLELIERDAVALWWYNRIQRPAVDLADAQLDNYEQLRDFYASINRNLWALDLTSDLGVPTFAVLSARLDSPAKDILFGFSAHLDARVALEQALNELNQCYPYAGARRAGSAKYQANNGEMLQWFKEANLTSETYLQPISNVPARRLANYAPPPADGCRAAVQELVRRAQHCGLEPFALNMTRLDIGMPVARVVVPGLRHFWRRLGPGRLYDVPVALGWLAQPRQEQDMNRFSIFF